MDQLQHMRADFGSCLNQISDEMCQMNTRIGLIAHRQSRLGGFALSPSSELAKDSSNGGDDGGDAFSFSDDEMIVSQ